MIGMVQDHGRWVVKPVILWFSQSYRNTDRGGVRPSQSGEIALAFTYVAKRENTNFALLVLMLPLAYDDYSSHKREYTKQSTRTFGIALSFLLLLLSRVAPSQPAMSPRPLEVTLEQP